MASASAPGLSLLSRTWGGLTPPASSHPNAVAVMAMNAQLAASVAAGAAALDRLLGVTRGKWLWSRAWHDLQGGGLLVAGLWRALPAAGSGVGWMAWGRAGLSGGGCLSQLGH